ncbi:hypothetical protein ID866_11000, partial [Astraeus odoratus]
MGTLTRCQAVLESLASTHHSSEAGEPFVSFSACHTTPKPPLPSTSARLSRPQTSHTPLSFPPSTPCPRNPRSPGDNDLGNDDDENPFNDNNRNNDDDDDNDNNDYEDTNDGTQEDQAVQVFKSLTHASRKSSSSSSQTKVHEPDTFDGTDPKKLCTFLVQLVFMQSYLKGMALKWFKLDLLSSGNPRSCPLWMDDWTEFVIELQSTFSPHNPVANAENQLDHLQMKDNQCINKYVVEFNQLASKVRGYGNGALHHQFYSGLPDHIKDSKLTPEERKQHLDNKLCMFCRDDGHFSNNCPKKANKGKAKACATNATQSRKKIISGSQDPMQIGSCIDPNCTPKEAQLNASTLSNPNSLLPKISLLSYEIPDLCTLVDSGSTHCFMDQLFINNYAISTYSVPPIQLWLIDGTSNFVITQAADVSVWFPMTGDVTPMTFYLVLLDSECKVVLGYNWL